MAKRLQWNDRTQMVQLKISNENINQSTSVWNKWCNGWLTDENDFLPFMGVIIPKGIIEKIVGRKITWEDESVEVRS